MSRCFPFPPPGYEKKTITEDLDLLKKEKHREKKHKKDNRDKEKKEGNEKRVKDRSDEKQKEKKEKKEKHRDKKRDKEKNRDKDKNGHVSSDEKRYLGHAEAEKGDKKYEKNKDREKVKRIVAGEKVTGYSALYNGVVLGKNSLLASDNRNFKQLHQLGNKTTCEDVKGSNLLSEKYPGMDIKKDVGMPRVGVTTPVTPMATSERSKERKVIDWKMDRHGPGVEGTPIENVVVQKVEGMTRQVEKKAGRKVEVKEKIRWIEGDVRKGEKRKDEDRDKSNEKYKENDKEKIKVERPKDPSGEIVIEQTRIKDSNKLHGELLRGKDGNKKDVLVAQSARPAKLVEEEKTYVAAATPKISRKRKEFGSNGVLHDGDAGPNKLAKSTQSSLPMTDDGRRCLQYSSTVFAPVEQQALSNAKQDEGDVGPNKVVRISSSSNLLVSESGSSMQPCQDSMTLTPVKQRPLSNDKEVYQEHRINGLNNCLQSASKAYQATAPTDQNSGSAKKKHPHPDTKYLTRVLSVPKMEWSSFDEQEWLFSSNQNRPMEETRGFDDVTPQVWAEPLRIEYADVLALPYVIPR